MYLLLKHLLVAVHLCIHMYGPAWLYLNLGQTSIRESVDSLCRDGADTPIVRVHWKAFLTREYSRFKPFSAREWPIQPLLYPMIPHK